jgi:hypothetical protein
MSKFTGELIRYALGAILLILAINAFAGGYYGISGAKNIPREWLRGSPFHDYFIPALILFFVVGGSALIAAIAVFSQHRHAPKAAYLSGLIVLVWLAVQISIIGYVSWMQPTTTAAGLLILFLTWRLPKYED